MRVLLLSLCLLAFAAYAEDTVTVTKTPNKDELVITVRLEVSAEYKKFFEASYGTTSTPETKKNAKNEFDKSILSKAYDVLNNAFRLLGKSDSDVDAEVLKEKIKLDQQAAKLKAARITIPEPSVLLEGPALPAPQK